MISPFPLYALWSPGCTLSPLCLATDPATHCPSELLFPRLQPGGTVSGRASSWCAQTPGLLSRDTDVP